MVSIRMEKGSRWRIPRRRIQVTYTLRQQSTATNKDKDINKALFDYRYRKQTQHHQQNNNKFYNNGGVHHQKNQMRVVPAHHHHHPQQQQGVHHSHGQYPHRQVVGGNNHLNGSGVANTAGFVNRNLPTPAPTPMVKGMPQQAQQQQVQQMQNISLLQHPQPQMFPSSTSGNQQVFQSVVAASPDSFVEELVSSSKFDPFVHSTNLSSSVSSGGGSTVSYGSNNDEYLNGKELFNVNVNVPNEFLNNKNNNNYNVNNGFEFNNENKNSVNCVLNNNRSDKNFGWLKIWGNDMSVWG